MRITVVLGFLFGIVTAVYSQNKITKVSFQENYKTKSTFLHRFVEVKKGQIIDSAALEKDVIRLKRLPATSHAYYQVNTFNDSINVVYGVQENFTIIPDFNFYTTNNGELAYRLGVYDFNFLGRNITFGGVYQRDIFDSYSVNFRAPFLFSNNFGLAVNYTNLTTKEPVFLNTGTADYKYNNVAYELLGLFQFNLKHRLEAGGSFFTEDYKFIEGATSPDVPQNFKVDKNLLKLIYDYNGLDFYYQYTFGFRSVLNLQYVTSANDILPDFLIFFNDFFYYKRIGKKGNFANRLRLGLATNSDSPFAPFAVDNNLNIRGVGNLIDRGTGVVVLNSEYRYTFWDKENVILQSNIFVDAGSWRNPGGGFSDFTNNDNFRIYPGAGLRFIHKRIFNAVFRIDYGYGVSKGGTNGFVFGVGQYF